MDFDAFRINGDPMVARITYILSSRPLAAEESCHGRAPSARGVTGWYAFMLFLLLFGGLAHAQNLNNSGQITNTGTIRVKDQAIGLPPVVNGRFEYFGTNQTVAARQYQSLLLSGSGTKTTAGGNVIIGDTLTITPSVTLVTGAGLNVILLGTLEEQGYLSGAINKTVDLSGATTSSNFGNIGTSISWTGTAPGITTVARTSAVASTGSGNQSILRYYDIAPTFGSNLNGTLTFRYSDNELNGHDANTLELWRSLDGGATWRRQGGTSVPVLKSVVKTGIVGFSRWTASDTSRLLGSAAYEWVASSVATASGDGQSGPTGSVLAPFVVTVTDFYANPIAGSSVTFVVDSIPSGATGYSLSTSNATTDATGQASTILTLGNQNGLYRVRAYSGSLSGSPRTFLATASSAAAAMLLDSGNGQVDTISATLAPFAVRVNDASGNSVAGVTVNFSISGLPAGQVGSALSSTSVNTNGLGIATTTLRLGNKVGIYSVTATTSALPAIQVDFNARATNGAATALGLLAGDSQIDTILTLLDTAFVVKVMDAGSNGVPNATVQFAISSTPFGAGGHSISATNVTTDSTGEASTRLTLGSKIGIYQVTATSGGLAGSPFVFTAQALRGAPALFTEVSGLAQQKTVTSTLDSAFVSRITDIGGNAIPGVPVAFTLISVPGGATGQSLSSIVDTTNASGEASTILTLGTKSGIYRVIATTAVLPADTTSFTSQAVAAAAASVLATSGDGQTRPAGALLQQPFIVTVSDAFGNPVSGSTVQFAVTSTPAGASGYQLTPQNVVTDAFGQASTILRLGSYPGVYLTTATVTGLPLAQFTATASFILADVNNDYDVNIADLTSIIDHILQRRTLTGIDSVKADANQDGAINVTDIVVIRNALLALAPLVKIDQAEKPGEVLSSVTGSKMAAPNISGELEVTPLGLRFNLTNDVPVKGVQLVIVLRTAATAAGTDVVFKRARQMDFGVRSQGQEIRLVAYNLQNSPIDTGSGSIVRIPEMADTSLIDSIYAVISIADTAFDVGLRIQVAKMQNAYPSVFRLYQNYPNPFNPQTTIEFEVPDVQGKFARTLVQVFNLLGEKVKTLARGEHAGGRYVVTWDGTDEGGQRVATGVYFYRLVSGEYVSAKKMVMLK